MGSSQCNIWEHISRPQSDPEAAQTCDLQGAEWKAETGALSPDIPQGNLGKWQQSLELSLNLNSLSSDHITPLCGIPSLPDPFTWPRSFIWVSAALPSTKEATISGLTLVWDHQIQKSHAHLQNSSLRVSIFLLDLAHQAQLHYLWLWACCTAGSVVPFIIGEYFLRRFINYWTRGLLSIWCHKNTNKAKEFLGRFDY